MIFFEKYLPMSVGKSERNSSPDSAGGQFQSESRDHFESETGGVFYGMLTAKLSLSAQIYYFCHSNLGAVSHYANLRFVG